MAAQRKVTNHLPTGLFDDMAFKTLYGGAMITWVSTNAICHAFGSLDRELTGLGVAMLVAFVAFLLSDHLNIRKILIVPFNGLLIYLTVVGGTSFLPDPAPQLQQFSPSASTEELATGTHNASPPYSFFTKWNTSQNLIEQNAALNSEKEQLRLQNNALQKANNRYARQLDSTKTTIWNFNLPIDIKRQLLHELSFSSSADEQTQLQ